MNLFVYAFIVFSSCYDGLTRPAFEIFVFSCLSLLHLVMTACQQNILGGLTERKRIDFRALKKKRARHTLTQLGMI